jgi:hypothetical protein
MSDERYVSDGNRPAARSQRREDSARSGLGTMARPAVRPRPGRVAEAGPAAAEPRRGRPARPASPQRPAAVQQALPVREQSPGRRATAQPNQRVAPRRPAPERPAAEPDAARRAGKGRFAAAGTRPAIGIPWRAAPGRRAGQPRPEMPRVPQAEPAQPEGLLGQAPQPSALAAVGPHRMPFVLLLCGLLGGALISALVISTTLAEGSFKISKLQHSTSALARQRQALEDQVAQAQSAQVIEERAAELGMRRTGELRFVDLKTGKVTDDGPTWAGAVNAPGYAP